MIIRMPPAAIPRWNDLVDASVTASSTVAASVAARSAVSAAPRGLSFAFETARCACGESCAPERLSSIVEVKLPAIRAPRIAIASRPAMRETPLLMPEATPTWCSGTELSAVAVSGATVAESPRPKTRIAGRT
jgi:hypothetical protein